MSSNKTVTMLPPPDSPDIPSVKELRLLQKYSGEFNWLATRTRPDISYYTSLLASSCSKYNQWSLDLAKKIHRYLVGTTDVGIVISKTGSESDLKVYTDAGFSGISKTHSQTGIIVMLGGSIIVWRSSKQSVIATSTCEAELYAASMGWQVVEGLRHLLADMAIDVGCIEVLIDNAAALTVAECGSTW